MVYLEELLQGKVIYERLQAIMTEPKVYEEYILPKITFELFLYGFQDGFQRLNKRSIKVEGFENPPQVYRKLIFRSMGEIYSIGYLLGKASSEREMINPSQQTREATNIYRVLGHIGEYITGTEEGRREYQGFFEEAIRKNPNITIIRGEG
jgi:hypothetical protein